MKKTAIIIAILLLGTLASAARGINFAVTLADEQGKLQPSTEATIRLSLIPEDASAQPTYIETHQALSNAYGVASLILGEGSAVAGEWEQVDWSPTAMYLKVERAASPSAAFTTVSVMRLGAVPYACHADAAERLVLTSPDGSKWEVKAGNGGSVYAESLSGQQGPEYGTVDYIFDMDALPSITLEVSTDEWNQFLANYDANPANEECIHADFYFNKRGRIHHIEDMGLRMRGNTSRVRPEGTTGELHTPGGPYRQIHFGFRFQKFHKDSPDHLFSGTDRFSLRRFNGDPTYCHEIYGFDLMRRFGVWTTARSSYCRLFLKIKEEQQQAYLGVFEMFEAYDDQYLNDQVAAGRFAGNTGFMWKGGWGSGVGANFATANRDYMGIENVTLDPSETQSFTYDYKSKKKKLEEAKDQLMDFIQNLNTLEGEDFHSWAEKTIDVDLMLRAMACEVAIGHWDNFWCNGNNFYIYFDNDGDGKMRYIPYDLDNTLGTSSGGFYDAATQNPLQWGSSPLANKLLSVAEYKTRFLDYLNELADPANDYIDPAKSAARITKWHTLISNYVKNDTYDNNYLYDSPAPWSSTPQYRILSDEDNFFSAKVQSIRNAQ